MTELDRTWARTQIEAMADGSLTPEAEKRMRVLMNIDPGIRADVEAATALRQSLLRQRERRVPRGLFWRLWRIPGANRPRHRNFWIPAVALASVAAVAIGLGIYVTPRGPTPEELAQQQAVEDFAIVVAYLQKSTLMASNEVNEAVGYGVRDALVASRGAIRKSEAGVDEGEQGNVD
jgi:hypothetical protein